MRTGFLKKSLSFLTFSFCMIVVLSSFALASPAGPADSAVTEMNRNPENQNCATVTGIVKLTILPTPEICGDRECTGNETCMSCPADCGICGPSQSLAGFMSGSPGTSASGLVAAFAFITFLLFMHFKPVLNGRNYEKFKGAGLIRR